MTSTVEAPVAGPARAVPLLLWTAPALLAVVVAVALSGAAPQPALPGLPDPGPVPGWSLPLVRLAGRAAALVAVGALLVALLARRAASPPLVAAAGLAWALATVAELLLGLAEVVALPLGRLLRGDLLRYWALDTAQGRGLLAAAVLAALLVPAAPLARRRGGTPALLGLALLALVPPLLAGHAASAGDHRLAQAAVVVHVLAAALWVGGLGALVLSGDPAVAVRFSPLALVCAAVVTGSGLLSGWLRLSAPSALGSGYGLLLVAKTALLLLLLAAGARHRGRTLPALAAGEAGAFRRLALGETAVMAVVVALAVALSRTPPA